MARTKKAGRKTTGGKAKPLLSRGERKRAAAERKAGEEEGLDGVGGSGDLGQTATAPADDDTDGQSEPKRARLDGDGDQKTSAESAAVARSTRLRDDASFVARSSSGRPGTPHR